MIKNETETKQPNKFTQGSETHQLFEFLSDGKAHTFEAAIKATKPVTGAINGKLASIKAWAKESGLYTLEVDRAADSITLTIGKAVKSSKPAAKKTTKTPVA